MDEAAARLARWDAAGAGDAAPGRGAGRLDDDLDTPAAVRALDEAVAAGRGVSQAAALLGVQLDGVPARMTH